MFHHGEKLVKAQDAYSGVKQQDALLGRGALHPAAPMETAQNLFKTPLKWIRFTRLLPSQPHRCRKIHSNSFPEKTNLSGRGSGQLTPLKDACQSDGLLPGCSVFPRFPAFMNCHPCWGRIWWYNYFCNISDLQVTPHLYFYKPLQQSSLGHQDGLRQYPFFGLLLGLCLR